MRIYVFLCFDNGATAAIEPEFNQPVCEIQIKNIREIINSRSSIVLVDLSDASTFDS